MTRRWLVLALALVLAACASRRPAAPVEDRLPPTPAVVEAPKAPEPPPPKPLPTHVVKRGETMVGIALQYGLDYRELAAWNLITNPNVLTVGQVLVVAAPAGARPPPSAPVTTPLAVAGPPIEARPLANTPSLKVEPRGQKVPFSDRALAQMASPEPTPGSTTAGEGAPPAATPVPVPPVAIAPVPAPSAEPAGTDREDVDWMWPVKGKVLSPFSETSKGVDIGGRKGAPVVAAAAGRVVYAGAGLRGYGKLVIIKHNNTWLSAYAHNDSLSV